MHISSENFSKTFPQNFPYRLFAHHIRQLDRKIGPGITKYVWTASTIKDFFVRDALRECGKVWELVKEYKANLAKLRHINRTKFASSVLILIERKHVHRDSEFRLLQEEHRAVIRQQFREAHAEVYVVYG